MTPAVLLDDFPSTACEPTLPLRYRVLLIVFDTAEATASARLFIGVEEREGRIDSELSCSIKPSPLSRVALIGVVVPYFPLLDRVAGEYDGVVLLSASCLMLGEDVLLDSPSRLLEPGVPVVIGRNEEDEGDRR